ncbi:hypothetical protein BD560DRAFT_392843 [Blakeslea trispora]|nr:hypothetical protein BD560DRAFT_392843 [Blakeslea trispora]
MCVCFKNSFTTLVKKPKLEVICLRLDDKKFGCFSSFRWMSLFLFAFICSPHVSVLTTCYNSWRHKLSIFTFCPFSLILLLLLFLFDPSLNEIRFDNRAVERCDISHGVAGMASLPLRGVPRFS